MDIVKAHIEWLGHRAKDRVTGFEGVVSCVTFDLYGCLQVVITPPMKDGDLKDGRWFDVNRLERTSSERVMPIPNFQGLVSDRGTFAHGPSDKPSGRY